MRHTKHLTLSPIDPPPAAFVDDPDELADGVVGSAGACEFLGGISKRQLHTLVQNGRVKVLQDGSGHRLYFPKRALVAYLRTLGNG